MSQPERAFERYRDALRAGHLAYLAGAYDGAARAYRSAARILPERTAPHTGLGRALLAAGRPADALAAFRTVLARSPSETAALEGAALALVELDRPDEAASVLDRLTAAWLERDRRADARAAMQQAFELSGSPSRRIVLERLRRGDPGAEIDQSAAPAIPVGATLVGASVRDEPRPPMSDEIRAVTDAVESATGAGDVAGLVTAARGLARAGRLHAAVDACLDALSLAPADPDVHRALADIERRRGRPAAAWATARLVERYEEVVDDPDELDRRAEEALVAGDVDRLLEVIEAHAARGRPKTGLELAFRGLAAAPATPGLYLAIARLHLVLGWRDRAIDIADRLARFVEIDGDARGRAALALFVGEALGPIAARTAPVG